MRFIALLAAAGCSTGTLAGEWEGSITCPGGGAAGLELELDEADDGAEGSGITWFDDSAGYYWEVAFEATVTHDRLVEGADLDMEIEDCVEFELGALGCPSLDDVVYLDEDTVEGEVSSEFFGLVGCGFEVELD